VGRSAALSALVVYRGSMVIYEVDVAIEEEVGGLSSVRNEKARRGDRRAYT